MDSRWYLQRHPAHPKLIRLVVEELGPEKRGCLMPVTCRPEARRMLPILRNALVSRVREADREPMTYDPVEA